MKRGKRAKAGKNSSRGFFSGVFVFFSFAPHCVAPPKTESGSGSCSIQHTERCQVLLRHSMVLRHHHRIKGMKIAEKNAHIKDIEERDLKTRPSTMAWRKKSRSCNDANTGRHRSFSVNHCSLASDLLTKVERSHVIEGVGLAESVVELATKV